jgi:hypothetical protein
MKKLFVLFLSLAVACTDSSGPTQSSVAGTWNLQTVDGASLPFVIDQSGVNKVEVTGDVLVVTSAGAFTQATSVRVTQNGVVTTQVIPDAGSYVIHGTSVTFQFQSDGSVGTGMLMDNTLTVNASGVSYIYTKQ